MIVTMAKTWLRSLRKEREKNPDLFLEEDRFLEEVTGVVHIGASHGQERERYNARGLSVIWVEPIPEVFALLNANIRGFKNQRAFQALVTDVDDKEYGFHIASNGGKSSSILALKQHKDLWPDIEYITTVPLKSITLTTLFRREKIDAGEYQALVMDTQGSELLVLRGSLPILNQFEFIKTEVADFESYEGCCQLSDINDFMTKQGYEEFFRNKTASRPQGGSYFDIVYKKRA